MLSGDDFGAVLQSRERRRSAHFSLHWRGNNLPSARLGLVVSKKHARTSVRRNLVKRQVRALFDAWQREEAGLSLDVVLRLNANVAQLGRRAQYTELQALWQGLPR